MEWLIEAHEAFKFPTEALYLAIYLFDRFLALHPVEKKRVILVGVTALQLAAKYAGIRESIPCVHSFSCLALISINFVLGNMQEYLMLKTLGYDLSISTPSIFMWKFLDETHSDDKIKNLSSFFIDLCLVRYETCTFRPSILTAAAIYTAHATVRRRKPCSKIYEQLTGCGVGQIWKCSRLMVTSHIKARSVESVYQKYNMSRYNWVARTRPARFLLTKFSKAIFITFKLILFLLKDT